MKTKNFSKKLTLNKKTVADLNNVQLGRAMGGGDIPQTEGDPGRCYLEETYDYTCPATCEATCAVSCYGTCVTCTCYYTDKLQPCTACALTVIE